MIASDSPITLEEIMVEITNRSGYSFVNYKHKAIDCDLGIGIELKKVRMLRILSIGKIEERQMNLENCKNLFLLSCLSGFNCFGLN